MPKGHFRPVLTRWGRDVGVLDLAQRRDRPPPEWDPTQYKRPVSHRQSRCRACRKKFAEEDSSAMCEDCWAELAARLFWGAAGFRIRDLAFYVRARKGR